ncbi:MAG: hypothetical protein ACLR8Y_00110 [Alistipes indistinctus]
MADRGRPRRMSSRGTDGCRPPPVPMYEVRMDFAAQGPRRFGVFRKYADSLAGQRWLPFSATKARTLTRSCSTALTATRARIASRRSLRGRVNHLEIKQISRFPILRLGQNRGGFIPVQINKRLLPNGPMASRTIGRANEAGTKMGASRERSTACCAGPTATC